MNTVVVGPLYLWLAVLSVVAAFVILGKCCQRPRRWRCLQMFLALIWILGVMGAWITLGLPSLDLVIVQGLGVRTGNSSTGSMHQLDQIVHDALSGFVTLIQVDSVNDPRSGSVFVTLWPWWILLWISCCATTIYTTNRLCASEYIPMLV